MKTFLYIILFLGYSCYCYAQEAEIQHIRDVYSTVNTTIEKSLSDDENKYFDVEINKVLAGSGQQKIHIRLFYRIDDSKEEIERSLIKAEKNYNIAAYEYREEFVFDDGTLLFYFHKPLLTGNRSGELRYYFSKGKLLKTIVYDTENNKIECEKDFDNEKLHMAKAIKQEAEQFQQMFSLCNDL